MGRRNKYYGGVTPRSSLTDSGIENALITLRGTQQRAVTALTSYTPTREDTIAMLFSADQIARATAAKGLITPAYMRPRYAVSAGDVTVGLEINYTGASCLPIDDDNLQIQPDKIGPLFAFIGEVLAIHDRYEEVKGVLGWFNRNATVSAVRYYWPPAMQLVPHAFRELQELPSRYNTPPGISDMLQSIRDSSATMAAAQLLPADVKPREMKDMRLTIHASNVSLGDQSYRTEQMVYNL